MPEKEGNWGVPLKILPLKILSLSLVSSSCLLLPGCHGVRGSALLSPPSDNDLLTPSPETIEPADHALKPRARINPPAFVVIAQVCVRAAKG